MLWHRCSSVDDIPPALEGSAAISTENAKMERGGRLVSGKADEETRFTGQKLLACCLAGSNPSRGVSGGISAFSGRPTFKKSKSRHSRYELPGIF